MEITCSQQQQPPPPHQLLCSAYSAQQSTETQHTERATRVRPVCVARAFCVFCQHETWLRVFGSQVGRLCETSVDMDVLAVSAVCLALIAVVSQLHVLADDAELPVGRKRNKG